MTTIKLTDEQLEKLKKDTEGVEMLSQEEVEHLATKINEKVNIPFLKDKKEQVVFVKIVKKLDKALYDALPNELYETIHDANDGIDKVEAEEIKERLSKYINKKVDIPYVPEFLEGKIFKLFVGLIVNALTRGNKIAVT